MSLQAALQPDRTLAFPFAAVLFPLLYFLHRDVGIRLGRADLAVDPSRVALLAVLALVASYAVATLVVAGLDGAARTAPGWASPLVSPSDATLVAFAAVSVLLGTYVVVGTVATVPGWVDLIATPVGLVLGWPVLVAVLASFVVGNAMGGGLPFLAEAGFVAVGVVVTVAWLFLVSSWIAALVGGLGANAPTRTA